MKQITVWVEYQLKKQNNFTVVQATVKNLEKVHVGVFTFGRPDEDGIYRRVSKKQKSVCFETCMHDQ